MTADNLILITIDALRHDALGCAASTYATTPNLDALARDGVLFEQAIANGPRTQSSFPSIMASLHPLAAGERRCLPRQATTLAEAAAGAGLATAGFNPSNPFLTRETGYDRGFGLFVDFWDVHERTGSESHGSVLARLKKSVHDAIGRRSLGFLMLLQALLLAEGGQYLSGGRITDSALAWIDDRTGRFFVWLHFMDVHFPYQPLSGERTWGDRAAWALGMAGLAARRPGPAVNQLKRLYGRRVELVDRFVGEIARGIEDRGLAASTILVVTSDHGEQIGERGRWAHGPDLHDELIRVPLVLRGPGLPASRRVSTQVELLGLAPTLLDLLGIEPPPSFLGTSFGSLAVSGSGSGTGTVFSEAMHSGGRLSRTGAPDRHIVTSCRADGWKYILDSEDEAEELYDLVEDPHELCNLVSRDPERAAEFRDRVRGHRRATSALASTLDEGDRRRSTPDDEGMRRRLAALGYL